MAAYCLLSSGPFAQTSLPHLRTLCASAGREVQREALDLALVSATMNAGMTEESVKLALQLVQKKPSSIALDYVIARLKERDNPALLR